jgi:hypothetical protein
VTTVGSSSPLSTLLVRCGTGAPHTIATIHDDFVTLQSLAWSSDGTELAWVTSKAFYIAQVKSGTWTVRNWTCQCGGVGFFGDQVLSVNAATGGGPMFQGAAVTQLLVFPQSGSAQPTPLPVTGIAGVGQINTEFRLLGNLSPTEVVVDFGYGHGTLQVQQPGPGTIFGEVVDFTTTAAGSELAFTEYSNGGACGGSQAAQLLDTASGAVSTPATPAGGGTGGYWVEGVWFDKSGTPYASLVPNASTCSTTGTPPAGGFFPAGATPTVVKLAGGAWVAAGTGVLRAAYGPGDWLAEQTGTTPTANDEGTSLTISDGAGTTPVKVAAPVTNFAWAP